MPASSSLWSRLFAWLFGRNASVPTETPTAAPNVTPAPAPSPPPTQPVAPVAPPVPAPPVFAPQGDREQPVVPDLPTGGVLPTEGVNLGFRMLWNNHPAIADGDVFPCKDGQGNPYFGNQCGIMMGSCLLRSGLLAGYDQSVCWYSGHRGHTLRARELAEWMRRHPDRFGLVEIRSNVSWGAFNGRTGFVCFQNFWGEGNQGDHIDLWDGTGLVRRETDASLEGPGMAHGSLDYFERSEEVWFWPVH